MGGQFCARRWQPFDGVSGGGRGMGAGDHCPLYEEGDLRASTWNNDQARDPY